MIRGRLKHTLIYTILTDAIGSGARRRKPRRWRRWEHVNLTGYYVWGGQEQDMSENNIGLRPLRAMREVTKKAA